MLIGDARGGDLGGRIALHSVVALSLLRFDRGGDGSFGGFRLTSMDAEDDGEAGMLHRLDVELAPIHAGGGGLITFAGRSHDLPVLERRAARHWLFDRLRYSRWRGRAAGLHLDLMRDGPGVADLPGVRWPSLIDCCAAFGIDAAVSARGRDPVVDAIRKSQLDVVATFLLHLYAISAISGSPSPLALGWTALARYLVLSSVRAEHLLPFARHPHVGAAKRLLPARSSGAEG